MDSFHLTFNDDCMLLLGHAMGTGGTYEESSESDETTETATGRRLLEYIDAHNVT